MANARLKVWRKSFCFGVVLVAASAAGLANATLLLDTGTGNGTTPRSASDGFGQGVDVNVTTIITQMALDVNMPNGGNLKYMIWNVDNSILLFTDTLALGASASPTFVLSDPFVFPLTAGNRYFFGAIADNLVDARYIFPVITLSQNGLSLVETGNSNYDNYASPTFRDYASAEMALQLYGTSASVNVPEPSTLALLVTGLAGLRLIRRLRE